MTETDLPTRPTNRDVAEYVTDEVQAQQQMTRGWIEAYIDSRLESVRDREKRFRIEMRSWFAGAVMLNALHQTGTITAVLGAASSVLGVHFLSRFFNR